MDQHLDDHELMKGQQRGAKTAVVEQRIIRMVTGKRNLRMAWVDVKKAYDFVDPGWLKKMMQMKHRFPLWFGVALFVPYM